KRALRIFFATDIHGSDRCFRKFLAAAKAYEADALVLGGDIAGKGLVPIRSHDGSLSARVRGEQVTVPRSEEGRLRAEINRIGFYSVIAGEDEFARMEADSGYLAKAFTAAIAEQVEGWCRLAEERLDPNVRCIITPGNDDPLAVDPVLRSAPRIECPEGELCEIGPVLLASCGDVTPTPWNTEREYQEDELYDRLAAILDPAPTGAKLVVNFHDPPYSSGLDFAAELDESLLPVIRGGRPSIIPVGSKAVRNAIKQYRPVVGLHGHIHESKGAQKIGETMCFNPGSDYSADLLRGLIVDVGEDGSFMDFLFTAG
ncbi:MAG TPA: metallophosphoesterase, partial [Candidatus Dormibacteraeota bacterium]|nr:metallophosphoesterase [Candidatus Dormibacteraeota bacterium]